MVTAITTGEKYQGSDSFGPLRGCQAAAFEPKDAIAGGGKPRVVRRDDRRQAVVRCMSRSSPWSGSAVCLVEITGGLVGQQERRLHHQRAGDGDALLLAAGKHARPMGQPLAQADAREQFRRRARRIRRGRARCASASRRSRAR